MKARIAVTTILALAAVSVAACDDDDDDPTGGGTITTNFSASLTGDAERPTPVVTTATGSAGLTAVRTTATGATTITYSVTVDGLSGSASAAHIHAEARGC